jgi:hypothetical protein
MNKFVKLNTTVDIPALLKELQGTDPSIWKADTYLRNYAQGPFNDTHSIILRFTTRTVEELERCNLKEIDQHECVWQDVANILPEHKKVVYQLANQYGATRIGRVMINRIRNGGQIWKHPDTPEHANYWCRIHVVVGAFPGVKFECGDETVEMTTGDVYFFRNEYPHAVVNNSGYDRIHMVVDLRIEEIKPGKFPQPEEKEELKAIWDNYMAGIKAQTPKPTYGEGITYQVERWNSIVREFDPFIEPHWKELGLDHIDVPVALDYPSYEKLDNDGHLHVVTVRDNGKLIGYHISLIRNMLHYANTLHAIVDLYYLKQEYRKSKIGVEMFQFAEDKFKELGVIKIINGSKIHLLHDKLFLGLGFKPTEIIYTKIITPKGKSNAN